MANKMQVALDVLPIQRCLERYRSQHCAICPHQRGVESKWDICEQIGPAEAMIDDPQPGNCLAESFSVHRLT